MLVVQAVLLVPLARATKIKSVERHLGVSEIFIKKSPQVSPEPSTPASPSATEEVVKEGLEWVSSWVEPAVLRVVVSLTEVGGVLSDALDGETIEFNINSIFWAALL